MHEVNNTILPMGWGEAQVLCYRCLEAAVRCAAVGGELPLVAVGCDWALNEQVEGGHYWEATGE